MRRNEDSAEESASLSSAAVLGRYGSTSAQDKSVGQFCVPYCGLTLYVMTFFGITCAFALRVSLSETIVVMVNSTGANVATNLSECHRCPRDPEVRHSDGELTWSRFQQGTVLAAFYYGHEFSQVCSAIGLTFLIIFIHR